MPFKFIREQSIKHSRDVVEQNLARYQPLNYNRFMWWRSHTDGIIPLSKRATLKERITNGDFNESSYFWQAQLALYNAKDKMIKRGSCRTLWKEMCPAASRPPNSPVPKGKTLLRQPLHPNKTF